MPETPVPNPPEGQAGKRAADTLLAVAATITVTLGVLTVHMLTRNGLEDRTLLSGFGIGRAELVRETRQLRREVDQLTFDVLEARSLLRNLEQEVAATLAQPDADWGEMARRAGGLAADCETAPDLPAGPQRQSETAYRTNVTVQYGQHPIFQVAESWPFGVELPDGSRLRLRVLPAALERLPDWQAGRTVEICFGWPGDAHDPVLLSGRDLSAEP